MSGQPITIQELYSRWANKTASEAEVNQLFDLLDDAAIANVLPGLLKQTWLQEDERFGHSDEQQNAMLQRILTSYSSTEKNNTGSLRRLYFSRWKWTAAAILILAIGSGIYYLNTQSYQSQKSNKSQFRQETTAAIAPGTDKAIWILSDGKHVVLDSTVLDMTSPPSPLLWRGGPSDKGYNELRTPRGGQYQLILPDGSKAWLNAASSIKYPVQFEAKERSVEVSGEVYFEIAKDVTKPFKVSGGGQEVEVLGTSFNINIYNDEPVKKTTLITGSIKIINNNQTAILKPNQQAQIINSSLLIINSSSDVIAWKNGLFNFNNIDFEDAMKQLERWYDIEVVYEKDIPPIRFFGEMNRNISLNDLLVILEVSKVRFRLEGRKLWVLS